MKNIILLLLLILPLLADAQSARRRALLSAATIDNSGGGPQELPGQIHRWLFSGDGTDAVGGNTATAQGVTLRTDRDGNANSAYEFASGDYMTLASTVALDTYSISWWAINNSITATRSYFGNLTWDERYSQNSNTLFRYRATINNSYQLNYYFDTPFISGSTWYHYVITRDGTTEATKLYINGTESTTGTVTVPGLMNIEQFGRRQTDGTTTLIGALDDIRIFNRVLTQQEVTDLYNE